MPANTPLPYPCASAPLQQSDPIQEAIASLAPLRQVIDEYQLQARKALGQNFLLDLNLTRKIARSLNHLPLEPPDKAQEGALPAGALPPLPPPSRIFCAASLFEIGPGPGGLTRALLLEGATNLIAIEKDLRCLNALTPLEHIAQGRLKIINGDALALNLCTLAPAPRIIVANLPYNIATPLLISWLRQQGAFSAMILMFQREVANRLIAPPNHPNYGRLSVLAQSLCLVKGLFELPPQAFTPAPKVHSRIVLLLPGRTTPLLPKALLPALEQVTAAAFGQRRKMLRQSLKSLCQESDALLSAAGIDSTKRAEALTIAEYQRLAFLWQARQAETGKDAPFP
jgi:16S rRNA (adenine1518-N6/adenine1519-N6)-dimethyltransferase